MHSGRVSSWAIYGSRVHWENYISISFQIEWDMFVVTDFLSILNQMEFHLVHNPKENCHNDHIPIILATELFRRSGLIGSEEFTSAPSFFFFQKFFKFPLRIISLILRCNFTNIYTYISDIWRYIYIYQNIYISLGLLYNFTIIYLYIYIIEITVQL